MHLLLLEGLIMKIKNYEVRCDNHDNPNLVDPYYFVTLELENHGIITFSANLSLGLHDFWVNGVNTFPGLTNCNTEAYKFCESIAKSITDLYGSSTDHIYSPDKVKLLVENYIKNLRINYA